MHIFQKIEIDLDNYRKYICLVDDVGEEIFNEDEHKWLVLFFREIEQQDFKQARWMVEHCPDSLVNADILKKLKCVLLSGNQLYSGYPLVGDSMRRVL